MLKPQFAILASRNDTAHGIWFGLCSKDIGAGTMWYYSIGPEAETLNWNAGYPIELMTCAAMNVTNFEWYTHKCDEELWVMCQEISGGLPYVSFYHFIILQSTLHINFQYPRCTDIC